VWIGHIPLGLLPFPDEMLGEVSDLDLVVPWEEVQPIATVQVAARQDKRFVSTFGPNGYEHEVVNQSLFVSARTKDLQNVGFFGFFGSDDLVGFFWFVCGQFFGSVVGRFLDVLHFCSFFSFFQ
jgi:hypothetical protein